MSDEKNSGNTFNINAVPSCIDEPVKAVLNPGANQIGTLFGDLLAMATSKIHFSAEKMRLQQAHDLEEFKKSLSDKLNAKPEECLVEPRMQVVGPAVENAKFCMDEPQIRKMFQNLLANSADIRYQSQVHPSFSAMIAQMSPLDAENLELFKGGGTLPIARYKYTLENNGERAAFTNCFLKNPKMIHATDIDLQATSLSSLERQDREIQALEEKLEGVDADFLMNEFTEMSLCCFRAHLAERYGKQSQRPVFSKEALWKTPGNVLEEYPVVLSTTYTARSSLGKNARFDYVVMDEASQVDVATGCLALSCARNAVIVGDTKQLPNVIASSQKKHLEELFEKYNIEDAYDFSQYSFLESLFALMKNRVPRVILREHYRCHPLIIGFCNQKFYNNELIVMTPDHGEKALKLVLTVPGQHERDRMNQRQIDVIKKDVLPGVAAADTEIGVIAPYRNQVYKLIEELNRPEIDISTVHKFQGREKDVIVLSTVDDIVTSFSDDPNLLNVAVSRAKKELVVVASEMEQPAGSNMGELIDYIRYHNCDVQYSAVSSVFDYLYKQYRDVRLDYLQKRGRISEFDSENLVYHLIRDELYQRKEQALDVVFHQPLYLLIRDLSKLDNREKAFVNSGVSHLDFLIYSRVSKRPILAIEVDGYRYHKEGTKQAERDKIKDDILAQYGIPLVRLATNGSDEARILSGTLDEIMGTGVKKD